MPAKEVLYHLFPGDIIQIQLARLLTEYVIEAEGRVSLICPTRGTVDLASQSSRIHIDADGRGGDGV